ncbi:MAG TPA: MarR family transcriptional regulator [Candidatus Limnocylindrales bacterium]|nr:MarR family transcriptional regulator [Candidatus Limnocylindrales bacterium]
MRLNISGTESSSAADGSRAALLARVESELLAWNPREFITAFRRLHQNAFSLLHLNVIAILDVDGPLPMSRLAEGLDVSVASATGIVDRMVKRGLVERRQDPADRRVVLVHPTGHAAAVIGAIDERRRQGLRSLLERLSDDELRALRAGHEAMRRARTELAAAREAGVDASGGSDIS